MATPQGVVISRLVESPEFLICESCRKPVDIYCEYDDDGNETLRQLIHANHLGRTPSHEIVPIPRGPGVEVKDFCDFCGVPQPKWMFPAQDFEDATASPTIVSQGGWACCEPCRPLVEAQEWEPLLDRFVKRRYGKVTTAQWATILENIRPLWDGFTKARTGPPAQQ